jgi:hypothetical protein
MDIVIGKPYIRRIEERNAFQLCSDIQGVGEPFTLWYEVENNIKEYLFTERSDAFLIGLLPYAMAHSTDRNPLIIKCEAPVSEKLYYQLKAHYIPALSKNIIWYHNVKIETELENKLFKSAYAVGTGVSGGVDSFYTLLNSKENSCRFQITHGLYFEYDPSELFYNEMNNKMRELSQNICLEFGINFVSIKSNICSKVYHVAHEAIITCMLLSYVYSLQKLFKIYYFSSGHTYDSFKIVSHSSELYNLLNVHCLSTESMYLYTTGSEVIRWEKTNYIADFDLPRKYLMVCRSPKVINGVLKNCSRCSKCTRTMIDLDLVGKLNYFSSIFDVGAYRKNPNYYLGYLSFKGKKDAYVAETLNLIKNTGKHFPICARIAGIKKLIKNGFKRGNPLQYDYRP